MKTTLTLAMTASLIFHSTASIATDNISDIIKRQAPQGISSTFYTCIDGASGMTARAACLTAERVRQDNRLNTNYKALMAKLSGKEKDYLTTSERAWMEFQKKSSEFEASLYGDEPIADLTIAQNEIFRLCDQANTLEKYFAVANDR